MLARTRLVVLGVASQLAYLFACRRIPDHHSLVPATTHEPLAIRTEMNRADNALVPRQGRLAYEVASRPLLAEYLHAVAATAAKIIARCGEFVATWGPIYAPDFAVDAQAAQKFLPRLCADEVYTPISITRHDDVA